MKSDRVEAMKKAFFAAVCVWALVAAGYFATSKWAIRHETLEGE
jgi:hypothetical protein